MMLCRHCGQPIGLTRYGWAHEANPGATHHYAYPVSRPAAESAPTRQPDAGIVLSPFTRRALASNLPPKATR